MLVRKGVPGQGAAQSGWVEFGVVQRSSCTRLLLKELVHEKLVLGELICE